MVNIEVSKLQLDIIGPPLGESSGGGGTEESIFIPFFTHNWKDRVKVTTSYQTSMQISPQFGAEERYRLLDRPTRTLRSTHTAMDKDQATRFYMTAARFAQNKTECPIYPDQSKVTVAASSGETIIFCDTTTRRFAVGAKIGIVPKGFGTYDVGSDIDAPIQHMIVQSITPTSISCDPNVPLRADVAVGDYVYPLMYSENSLRVAGAGVTDVHAEYKTTFVEENANSTLPATHAATLPAGFATSSHPTYGTLPIFTPQPNWRDNVKVDIDPQIITFPTGKTRGLLKRGIVPLLSAAGFYEVYDRASWYSLLNFFDSRRGRGIPFYFINPLTVFEKKANTSNTIDVAKNAYVGDIDEFISRVAVEYSDGTDPEVLTFSSVAYDAPSGYYRFTFGSSLASTAVKRITTGHVVRFRSDTFAEEWYSTDKVRIEVGFQERRRETSVGLYS